VNRFHRWYCRTGHADTMVLVEPDTFADRLGAAGFVHAEVEAAKSAFRFRAVAPAADRAARPG